MKYRFFTILLLQLMVTALVAQNQEESLPFQEIPDYPEAYTAEAVAARMADGLGFRYYWATEGLREEDLAFRPSEAARTSEETIRHIYGLSVIIVNAVFEKANESGAEDGSELTFEQLRRATLNNLKLASDKLRASPEGALNGYEVVFKRGETSRSFPFWNLINGPIADAIWHTGQVVSFRRSSGNPINPKVSVFSGRLVE